MSINPFLGLETIRTCNHIGATHSVEKKQLVSLRQVTQTAHQVFSENLVRNDDISCHVLIGESEGRAGTKTVRKRTIDLGLGGQPTSIVWVFPNETRRI